MKARIEQKESTIEKPFSAFEAGDFLVSDVGNVGIKTSDGGILWASGNSAGRMTYGPISRDYKYRHPQDVLVVL